RATADRDPDIRRALVTRTNRDALPGEIARRAFSVGARSRVRAVSFSRTVQHCSGSRGGTFTACGEEPLVVCGRGRPRHRSVPCRCGFPAPLGSGPGTSGAAGDVHDSATSGYGARERALENAGHVAQGRPPRLLGDEGRSSRAVDTLPRVDQGRVLAGDGGCQRTVLVARRTTRRLFR